MWLSSAWTDFQGSVVYNAKVKLLFQLAELKNHTSKGKNVAH